MVIAHRCREELGISAAEIARQLGVNTSSIIKAIARFDKIMGSLDKIMGSDTKIDFYADIIRKSGYAEKAICSGTAFLRQLNNQITGEGIGYGKKK